MTTNTNLSTQRLSARGGARRLITSFSRPANTTAYTAGDIITDSTSATVLGFRGAGVGGKIRGASVIMGETDTANLQLIVFDEEPTNKADNSALALTQGDLDKVVGVFNFLDASKINIGSAKEFYRADVEPAEYAYTSTDGQLFAFLVTRSGFTPASETVVAVNLYVEGNK
jgi:hypothetical protein